MEATTISSSKAPLSIKKLIAEQMVLPVPITESNKKYNLFPAGKILFVLNTLVVLSGNLFVDKKSHNPNEAEYKMIQKEVNQLS